MSWPCKLLIATSVLLLAPANVESGNKPARDLATLERQRQNLSNYAFCMCLRYAAPGWEQELVEDGSSSAFFEVGTHGLSAYEEVDRAAKRAAGKEKLSKQGRPLSIMKCLEFYNSRELASLVRAMDKRILDDGM